MNSYIFAYPGAPLKHLKVHTSGSQVVQSGVMHKIVDIPFEIGNVSERIDVTGAASLVDDLSTSCDRGP